MSNIEDIREGDLVEAVNGETIIRGRVGSTVYESRYIGRSGWRVAAFGDGWTLTVIEKAAPPLPTEPGHYLDRDGLTWTIEKPGDTLNPIYAPYTRLEPVPDTVKRVADYLRGYGRRLAADDVEEHFGVTS